MRMTVQAGGWARRWLGGADSVTLEVNAGATALACALAAGLPADEIGLLEVDGRPADPGQPMEEGQTLKVYAQILGG